MVSPAQFIDDPRWADFIPETKEASRTRHLPAHEDCSRLDADAVAGHLAAGGTLGRMARYEERPGQLDMARAITAAFNSREHLMVEAGTGVGKSLAYLVPSILWAWENDTPVVVSTATRNLQSQLVNSDIPKALEVLGGNAANFKTALLKGRSNYLCLRAVGDFFAAGFWTMSREEQDEMPHFIEWLTTTPDGDLDTYDGLPRHFLSCTGDECGGRRCRYYSRCFVRRARKKAADAHLIVANHALVLSEAVGGAGTILPAYGRLVLDEAHNLEDTATDALSGEFSREALVHILNRLMRKGGGKRPRSGGVLAAVERQLQKGVLSGSQSGASVARLAKEMAGSTTRLLAAAEDALQIASRLLSPVEGADVVRYRFAEGVRRYSVRGLFREYSGEEWDEASLHEAETRLENEVAGMVRLLHELRDVLNGSTPEGELNFTGDLAVQLDGIADSLVAFANEAHFVLAGEKETHAYWAERCQTPARAGRGRGRTVRLVAAPLSVAEPLKKLLYEPKDSVILSSATLRVGGDFKYMSRRLGCDGRFRSFVAASPFNYLVQARVLAPDCLPDPAADAAGYARSLAVMLKDLFAATGGRALVLFTSYEMMNSVAANLRGALEGTGIDLLVQGEGMSRESMTRALKGARGTVLFGAQSFWEGVDVAGEALSCVVIARLPFAQVGSPIVEARREQIDRDGGSSFRDYTLPEAVIKFRQGFGRLIRSKRDRGVVVVADPRIVTKNYGAVFRKSIPASVHTVVDLPQLLSDVSDFFDN